MALEPMVGDGDIAYTHGAAGLNAADPTSKPFKTPYNRDLQAVALALALAEARPPVRYYNSEYLGLQRLEDFYFQELKWKTSGPKPGTYPLPTSRLSNGSTIF
jgi:hypothetical protein